MNNNKDAEVKVFHLEDPSTHCVIMIGPEEDRNEGEPHDAGGVHREPDVLGLVEV